MESRRRRDTQLLGWVVGVGTKTLSQPGIKGLGKVSTPLDRDNCLSRTITKTGLCRLLTRSHIISNWACLFKWSNFLRCLPVFTIWWSTIGNGFKSSNWMYLQRWRPTVLAPWLRPPLVWTALSGGQKLRQEIFFMMIMLRGWTWIFQIMISFWDFRNISKAKCVEPLVLSWKFPQVYLDYLQVCGR